MVLVWVGGFLSRLSFWSLKESNKSSPKRRTTLLTFMATVTLGCWRETNIYFGASCLDVRTLTFRQQMGFHSTTTSYSLCARGADVAAEFRRRPSFLGKKASPFFPGLRISFREKPSKHEETAQGQKPPDVSVHRRGLRGPNPGASGRVGSTRQAADVHGAHGAEAERGLHGRQRLGLRRHQRRSEEGWMDGGVGWGVGGGLVEGSLLGGVLEEEEEATELGVLPVGDKPMWVRVFWVSEGLVGLFRVFVVRVAFIQGTLRLV